MATYPSSLKISEESFRRIIDNPILVFGEDGVIRPEEKSTIVTYTFTVVHDLVTESEAATVEALYAADKIAMHLFRWTDNVLHSVFFMQRPVVHHIRGDKWKVVSELFGWPDSEFVNVVPGV